MNELKVFVERCVRPVVMEESGKLRMRRELYLHAKQAYEQELTRCDDADEALRRTLARMGEVELITKELQESVRPVERWVGLIDQVMQRPEGMPVWRFSLRVAGYFGITFLGVLACVLAVRLTGLIGTGPMATHEWRLLGAIVIVWILNLLVCSFLYARVFDIFEQEHWTTRRVIEVVALSLTTAVDVMFSGWLLTYLGSGDTNVSILALPYWATLAAIAAAAIPMVAWLSMKQLHGIKEWRELEIEG